MLRGNRVFGAFVFVAVIMCLIIFAMEDYRYTPRQYTISELAPCENAININTASLSELDTLPGIGPATAQKIIRFRTQERPFETVYDIKLVSGIGDETFSNICDLICVE